MYQVSLATLSELWSIICAYGFGPAEGVEYIGELFSNLGSVPWSCASHPEYLSTVASHFFPIASNSVMLIPPLKSFFYMLTGQPLHITLYVCVCIGLRQCRESYTIESVSKYERVSILFLFYVKHPVFTWRSHSYCFQRYHNLAVKQFDSG